MIDEEMRELKELTHKQENSNKVQFSHIKRNALVENCKTCLGFCSNCVCCCNGAIKIQQGEIGLLMKFGKYVKKLPPGLYIVNPCTESIIVKNIRSRVSEF